MQTVEELQEKAVRYFCDRPSNFPVGRPFNCCESVLLALKDILNVDSSFVPRIGTGIGAGVSLNGLLCGAISSVAIALGIKYGRNNSSENPQPMWSMVDSYVSDFKNRFGYMNCRQLTNSDLKTSEGLKEYFTRIHDYSCAERVRFAVAKAYQMLQE